MPNVFIYDTRTVEDAEDDDPVEVDVKRESMAHETWSTHLDYLLTVLGYSVGVGSLWKFPYMCLRNGGGAFLIPFILFTIIGAVPCVLLEMTIGQYSQSGPVNVWNLCPPFKGIGIGTVLITQFFSTYYPALFAWVLYYLYHSFFPAIPWANCDNEWNTPSCVYYDNSLNVTSSYNVNTTSSAVTDVIANGTYFMNVTGNSSIISPGLTAAEEFWKLKVLEITDGLTNIGELRWPLVGCLAITYFAVFLCMFQGIKVSGKVVYITVSLPYILLTIFLVRGCLLPGSADGIYYFIYPKFEKLLEPRIWIEACNYALYSLGVAWGCIITMTGHNKFSNNCFRDAIIITIIDALTAIYIGFAFFAVMGHVAYLRGVTVDAFQSSGFNLGFIVYPEAVSSLPFPQVWSALTFIMILALGIDSLVPCFEMAVTALMDRFPRFSHRRWIIYLVVLIPSFLIGLVYMTQGGMYILTLVEWYAFFPSMALFAMLECFVVSWIYGTSRMEKDILLMWGKSVPRVMYLGMKFVCPTLFSVVFCYSLYSYRPPKYGDYIYPDWATGIGWVISFASLVPLPVCFVWTVYKTKGESLKEKIKKSMEPNMHWGPITKSKENLDVRDAMI